MFKQRVITALLLAPLALLAVFYLPLPGFSLFVSAAFLVGAWEWSGFFSQQQSQRKAYVLLTGCLLLLLNWQLTPQLFLPLQQQPLTSVLLYAGLMWWLLAAMLVLSYPRTRFLWANSWIKGLLGWLTLLPAWTAILFIRQIDYSESPFFGAWLLCGLLGLVWAADIGGYIVGKPFGKRKLLPDVSPGKTLEGALGGLSLVLLLLTAAVWYLQWPEQSKYWYLAAAGLTVLSILGDLTESMFKRVAGIKDSGAFLPGHGGILDRIDSLTAVAPLFAVLVAVLGGFF